MDSSRPASSPLLEPAEQQMLKLITRRREQGASLSEILGDMELTSGADRPVFRLAPAVEAEAKVSARYQFDVCMSDGFEEYL